MINSLQLEKGNNKIMDVKNHKKRDENIIKDAKSLVSLKR